MTTTILSPGNAQPDRHGTLHDVLMSGDESGAVIPDCQSCGACCSYSSEWPRFSTETDEALDLVPLIFVADDERGMRCDGARCSALSGRVGESTLCLVYDVRPEVCRECSPGDPDCKMARAAFGME